MRKCGSFLLPKNVFASKEMPQGWNKHSTAMFAEVKRHHSGEASISAVSMSITKLLRN
jgi:hypothetical protein